MSTAIVLLSLAYAGTTALLLNLGFAARMPVVVKAMAALLVGALYVGAYEGYQRLAGWPAADAMPERFRLHWITIDEPDKAGGAPGAIYFWIRELDAAELPIGEPRAYRRDWDQDTAAAARDALVLLANGKPLNGFMQPPVNGTEDADERGEQYAGMASSLAPARPRFEFARVPPPALPAKPALPVRD